MSWLRGTAIDRIQRQSMPEALLLALVIYIATGPVLIGSGSFVLSGLPWMMWPMFCLGGALSIDVVFKVSYLIQRARRRRILNELLGCNVVALLQGAEDQPDLLKDLIKRFHPELANEISARYCWNDLDGIIACIVRTNALRRYEDL